MSFGHNFSFLAQAGYLSCLRNGLLYVGKTGNLLPRFKGGRFLLEGTGIVDERTPHTCMIILMPCFFSLHVAPDLRMLSPPAR